MTYLTLENGWINKSQFADEGDWSIALRKTAFHPIGAHQQRENPKFLYYLILLSEVSLPKMYN